MICGIYLIWNPITQKGYVGKSINIERRWGEHIRDYNSGKYSNLTLYKTFEKYGPDKFEWYVLGEYEIEYLNHMEIEWIQYYNSYENGYNMTTGGEGGTINYKLKKEYLLDIINLLKNTNKSPKEIASIYEISDDIVWNINTGRNWTQPNIKYPIRVFIDKWTNKCKICGYLIPDENSLCKECHNIEMKGEYNPNSTYSEDVVNNIIDLLKISNLTTKEIGVKMKVPDYFITSINRGTTRRRENVEYPIRENRYHIGVNKCIDCGESIVRKSTRCLKCSQSYFRGSKSGASKYSEEQVDQVIALLKTTEKSYREIGEIVNMKSGNVSSINSGRSRIREKESYPIR